LEHTLKLDVRFGSIFKDDRLIERIHPTHYMFEDGFRFHGQNTFLHINRIGKGLFARWILPTNLVDEL